MNKSPNKNTQNVKHDTSNIGPASESLRIPTHHPRKMDGIYYGLEFDGIHIDDSTLELLQETFTKFLPPDAPGDACDRLDPGFMKKKYEDSGLDEEVPSMYAMIKWMNEEYINNG